MLDHNGICHFGSSIALGSWNPICVKNLSLDTFEPNPDQAMASSATSATSFELIEDQTLTVEEVEMASQEAQEIRTREAAVAAGLVLDEPEAPPSASATDVMKDLSSALERLRFATPTSGLGAPGPAEEEDKDMEDADVTERATPPKQAQTPPTKRLRGFVAASQKTTAHVNKPVSLVPVEGRPGYFKLVEELLRKRTRQRRSPWQTRSRLTGGWTSGRRSCPWRRTTRRRSGNARRSRSKCSGPLKEAEAQSFQLYHPQVDQAIRKKEELHKALREHREPTPQKSSARRRHKELVTEEMLDNEMAILAPLQEGAGPAVRGGGQ